MIRKIVRKHYVPKAPGLNFRQATALIKTVCDVAGSDDFVEEARTGLVQAGVLKAVQKHDDAVLFDWLMEAVKVLSMSLADLLLAGDRKRERWRAAGAQMIAIDTLVHAWLHRTGILRGLDAEHAYGPGCYGEGRTDPFSGQAPRLPSRRPPRLILSRAARQHFLVVRTL